MSESTVYVPDVAIICDPTDSRPRYFQRPCVIIEVLSPSTEMVDRREKVLAYHQIDRLLAYLIVHQDAVRVERHWRDHAAADWQLMIYTGGSVPVPCVDASLNLDDLYRGVELAVE